MTIIINDTQAMSHRQTQKASHAPYKVKGARLKPPTQDSSHATLRKRPNSGFSGGPVASRCGAIKRGVQGHLGAGKLSSVML